MAKRLLDTNLIIRFILNDDPKKAIKVEKLLGDKSKSYLLLDMVVAEIIWVLKSYYGFDKTLIIDKVKSLIHLDTIDCNSVLLDRALYFWEKFNISFIDAYLAATSESENVDLYSYDLKFDKIKTIKRKEP